MRGVRDHVVSRLEQLPVPAPARAQAAPIAHWVERLREMVQDAARKGERLSESQERVSSEAQRLTRRLEEEHATSRACSCACRPPARRRPPASLPPVRRDVCGRRRVRERAHRRRGSGRGDAPPVSERNATELGAEIAHVLADAIGTALTPSAPAESWRAARDAAQLLSLEGLDRALQVCELHVGRALPPEVTPIAERLDRYAAAARASGELAAFRDHDAELGALAEEAGGLEWSESDTGPAVATLGLTEALGDIMLATDADQAVARRVRVTAAVAAALRATLDWLLPEHSTAPIRLTAEPAALQLRSTACASIACARRIVSSAASAAISAPPPRARA
jgi:hypothetical protein